MVEKKNVNSFHYRGLRMTGWLAHGCYFPPIYFNVDVIFFIHFKNHRQLNLLN